MRAKKLTISALLVTMIFAGWGVGALAHGDNLPDAVRSLTLLPSGLFQIITPAAVPTPSPAPGAKGGDAETDGAGDVSSPEADQVPIQDNDLSFGGWISEIVQSAEAGTDPYWVQVTKPVVGEMVSKDTFSICGARNEDVVPSELIALRLLKFNAQTEQYEAFADVDGESVWTIDINGVFTKNVLLSEGENRFAIAAYRLFGQNALTAQDVQVTKFSIVYIGQDVAEKISEKLKELTVSSIFKEIEKR